MLTNRLVASLVEEPFYESPDRVSPIITIFYINATSQQDSLPSFPHFSGHILSIGITILNTMQIPAGIGWLIMINKNTPKNNKSKGVDFLNNDFIVTLYFI